MSEIILSPDGFPLNGWRDDLEDFQALAEIGDDIRDWQDAVSGLYSAPPELNRRWLRTENQGQQGACQGFAVTEVGEVCFNVGSGGKIIQFAPQWSYIESQRYDGITGDRGSTLFGGARLAKELGFILDATWPYPGKYVTKPPVARETCLAEAKSYRLKNVVRLKSYQQVFDWLAGGVGSVWIGRKKDWGGGHATHIPGYSSKVDPRGRHYLDEHNSWGTAWQDKGWKLRSPAEADAWFTDPYTVVMGASDMATIVARPVDFSKELH